MGRRQDPGDRDVGVPRLAGVGSCLVLQGGAVDGEVVGDRVVGVDRQRPAVLPGEDDVAEGVVEVLVGVDHGDHLADAERSDLLDDPACLDLGGVRVDHQQATLAGDEPDVDVEELETCDPAAVRDLHEAGVVGDVT